MPSPLRGDVFFPKQTLPPGSPHAHRVVVLTSNAVLAGAGNSLFVTVAVIRSAVHPDGRPVRPFPGHSIPVSTTELSCLATASLVETHQLFGIPLLEFSKLQRQGQIRPPKLDEILQGARRLLS